MCPLNAPNVTSRWRSVYSNWGNKTPDQAGAFLEGTRNCSMTIMKLGHFPFKWLSASAKTRTAGHGERGHYDPCPFQTAGLRQLKPSAATALDMCFECDVIEHKNTISLPNKPPVPRRNKHAISRTTLCTWRLPITFSLRKRTSKVLHSWLWSTMVLNFAPMFKPSKIVVLFRAHRVFCLGCLACWLARYG